MQIMSSQAIKEKISELRKKDIKNFQTNYFLNELDESVECLENNNAIIFLNKEKNFYKLFYAFTNLSSLEELFRKLPNKEIYLEVISKTGLNTDLKQLIDKYFSYATTYQKLYKKLDINESFDTHVYNVDVNLIYEKLYSTFDIRFEHLMEIEEVEELAKRNQIITIYENNELKSFLIYKIQGSKAYLNHIANYGSKENLINLWKLFYQELNNQRIIYLDLWYNKQNKKAENMYNIEQFQPLNMYNFCYEKL